MTELKLYKTASKGLKIIALSLPICAIAVWSLLNGATETTDYIMEWFGASFFGLATLVGIFHSVDRRPQIIINENGIWDRTTNQDEIKWEQIKDSYPLDIFNQKFISIVSDGTFVFRKEHYKWAAKINRAVGAQNLNLHLGQISINERRLSELINKLAKAEKNDRKQIILAFKNNPESFSLSRLPRILLYLFMPLILLLLSFTSSMAFLTIMILSALGAVTALWYWGSTEKSIIRRYAGIFALFGFVNMFLCLATLKTHDYLLESVGQKLSLQIDNFAHQNSTYPTDLNLIKEKANLTFIEEIIAEKVQFTFTEANYELTVMNLVNQERIYYQETGEWKKNTANNTSKQ